MKIIVTTILALLSVSLIRAEQTNIPVASLAKSINLYGSPTNSPATLIERYGDGTLLIMIEPKIYMSDLGCTMIETEFGSTSQIYYCMQFEIEKQKYWTIWGVQHGTRPPIHFEDDTNYRFLIQAAKPPAFSVLKVWLGDKLLYETKEDKKAQPEIGHVRK